MDPLGFSRGLGGAHLLALPWGGAGAAAERLRWGAREGLGRGGRYGRLPDRRSGRAPAARRGSGVAAALWTVSPGKRWLSAAEPQSLPTRGQTGVRFLLNDSRVPGCGLPCQESREPDGKGHLCFN